MRKNKQRYANIEDLPELIKLKKALDKTEDEAQSAYDLVKDSVVKSVTVETEKGTFSIVEENDCKKIACLACNLLWGRSDPVVVALSKLGVDSSPRG